MVVLENDEVKAVCNELPLNPPIEAIDKAKRLLQGDFLIYKADYQYDPLTGLKEKCVCVHCTACGEEYFVDYVPIVACSAAYAPSDSFGFWDSEGAEIKYSYQGSHCHVCGAKAQVIHISKIKERRQFDCKNFVTLHIIRGHLTLLIWRIHGFYDKRGQISYEIVGYEGLSVIEHKAVRFVMNWASRWVALASIGNNCVSIPKDRLLYFEREAYISSGNDKNALDVFFERSKGDIYPLQYLQLWAKLPQIENFVRSGYLSFVSKLINSQVMQSKGSFYGSYHFYISNIMQMFNKKKYKPHEILGIEKEDMHLLDELSIDHFRLYQFAWKKEKLRLSRDQLARLEKLSVEDVFAFFAFAKKNCLNISVIRFMNYLEREKGKAEISITSSYFKDYLDMVKNVYDGISEELLFPKDLQEAHDRMVKLQEDKENELLNRKIGKRCELLQKYSFSDVHLGLVIFPCPDQTGLIKEGKLLSHCVARYARDVSIGKTNIFFIRKIDSIDKPFYTLEYKNNRIIQDHGYKNKLQTDEIKEFEKKWLNHVEEVKKNGKRSSRKESESRLGA